jgi:hypothetical protein
MWESHDNTEEMGIVNGNTDKCKQLRELHDRLADELRILKESVQEEEHEGIANPLEMVNIIKSLQMTLTSVDLELQKCQDTHSEIHS